MKILLMVAALMLLLGPFRKIFFGNWRFSLAAVAGGIISWSIVSKTMRPLDPWWMPYAAAFLVAFGAGAAVKQCLDDIFGKE